jgi:virginiamycin B lyase
MKAAFSFLMALAVTLGACTGAPSGPRQTTGVGPSALTVSPTHAPPNLLSAVQHPIDLLRPRVIAQIDVGGAPQAPDWQVSAYGSVWVANAPKASIQRIDPLTNQVIAAIRVDDPCNGLAASFGSIWAPGCADELVTRIDARTNRVVARIHAHIFSEGEGLIAAGAGGVWVVTADKVLSRIDPSSNRIVAKVAVPEGSTSAVVGFGSVWVTSYDTGTVVRVDPARNTLEATIAVGAGPRFLAAGEGSIWVLNQRDGTVSRIDPATATVVATIDAQLFGEGGCIAAGLGAAWVTLPGAPLTRIDAASGAVTEQFVGQGGDCLSVGFGSVWLSNHAFGNVWRISPS